MPTTFQAASRVVKLYAAFVQVKQLVADFQANEKFYLSPAYRCGCPDCQIEALADVLYLPAPRLRQTGALTPAKIKIVEENR